MDSRYRRQAALSRRRHDHHRRLDYSQDRQHGSLKVSYGICSVYIFRHLSADRERRSDSVLSRGDAPADLRCDLAAAEAGRRCASTLEQTGFSLGGMVQQFEHVLPKSQAEISVVQQRLIRAGYRKDSAIKLFYGAKVLVPLGPVRGGIRDRESRRYSPFFVYRDRDWDSDFCCRISGWANGSPPGKRDIRRGLPDVLDLLVICIEAGSQPGPGNRSHRRGTEPGAAGHLRRTWTSWCWSSAPDCPRAEAWKHFADRTGVDSVRNLVSVLVQSEQLGTSVAKTLRVHSDTLQNPASPESGGAGGKDHGQTGLSACLFYLPLSVSGDPGPGGHHHDGEFRQVAQIEFLHVPHSMRREN